MGNKRLNISNVYADTRGMSRQAWLESRRNGIGGSDASAILGMNPYSSPLRVYMDKTGKGIEEEENEAMRQGTDLEPYVAERFVDFMAKQGTPKKVRKCNRILRHPEYPWMLANIDREVVGENAGLECKTTSPYSKFRFDEGEINPHYYWQCVHYMAVTGAEKWYVSIVVLGKSHHVFCIGRDEDEIATLIEAEREFWEEHVAPKVPPLPTGSEADDEALNALYPMGKAFEDDPVLDGESVMALDGMDDLLNLRALKVREKEALEAEIKEMDQTLKLALGDFQRGVSEGWTVRWTNTSTSRVDTKALKAKYPEIAKECMRVTEGRRFSVARVSGE